MHADNEDGAAGKPKEDDEAATRTRDKRPSRKQSEEVTATQTREDDAAEDGPQGQRQRDEATPRRS
eukprot:3514181-Amphidinium_carterae.1